MSENSITSAKKIAGSKKAAPATSPPTVLEPEILLAWAMPPKNPRLLIAYRQGDDPSNPTNLVSVRVRDNQNFMLNMRFKAYKTGEKQYDLVGEPPRWKGRW
jgi:hypothetical protein